MTIVRYLAGALIFLAFSCPVYSAEVPKKPNIAHVLRLVCNTYSEMSMVEPDGKEWTFAPARTGNTTEERFEFNVAGCDHCGGTDELTYKEGVNQGDEYFLNESLLVSGAKPGKYSIRLKHLAVPRKGQEPQKFHCVAHLEIRYGSHFLDSSKEFSLAGNFKVGHQEKFEFDLPDARLVEQSATIESVKVTGREILICGILPEANVAIRSYKSLDIGFAYLQGKEVRLLSSAYLRKPNSDGGKLRFRVKGAPNSDRVFLTIDKETGKFQLGLLIPEQSDPGPFKDEKFSLDLFVGNTHYAGDGQMSRELPRIPPKLTRVEVPRKASLRNPSRLTVNADFNGHKGGQVVWTVSGPMGSQAKVLPLPPDPTGAFAFQFLPDGPGKYSLYATAEVSGLKSERKEYVVQTTLPPELRKYKCELVADASGHFPHVKAVCTIVEAVDPDGDRVSISCDCSLPEHECVGDFTPFGISPNECGVILRPDDKAFGIKVWLESEGERSKDVTHSFSEAEVAQARQRLQQLMSEKGK